MGSLRESEVDGFVDERTGRVLEIFSACPSVGVAVGMPFILHDPHSEADLENVRVVFDCARRRALEAA